MFDFYPEKTYSRTEVMSAFSGSSGERYLFLVV